MSTRARCTPLSVVAFTLVALAANASQATVITTNCADASFCFVRELLAGGTIQVDDKLFHEWSASVNPANFAETRVSGLDDEPLNPGIRFTSGLFVAAPNAISAEFDYTVSVLDPSLAITDNSLALVSRSFSPTPDALRLILVSEAVFEPGVTEAIAGTRVFESSEGADPFDSADFAPQDEVRVSNEILLRAGNQKGDLVKLNVWDQRFSQTRIDTAVPEPSAALLFAGGALLTFRALRSRRLVGR